LGAHGRLPLNRVDQSGRQGLVIGIGPLRLGYDLLNVVAEEDKVVLDVLLTDESAAVYNLSFGFVRLLSLIVTLRSYISVFNFLLLGKYGFSL